MTARVINLARFRTRQERARRQAAAPHAEGRTLVIDGLRYWFLTTAAHDLAAQIYDVLTGHQTVARGGIVIGPVQGRRGLHRFTLDCRCFDLPMVEVSRGQLAAIAQQMLVADSSGGVVR